MENLPVQPSPYVMNILGKELPILGTATETVGYENKIVVLPIVVIKGQGANLFGQNWLDHTRYSRAYDQA